MKSMAKVIYTSLVCLTIILLTSCGIQRAIKRNEKSTEKAIANFYEKYENVFYLKSTNSTFSTVWSYREQSLIVSKIERGKILESKIFANLNSKDLILPSQMEIELDLKKCGYELDGDIIGYKIQQEGIISENSFPVSIECLKKENFQTSFFSKLSNDIKNYKMWDVVYGKP